MGDPVRRLEEYSRGLFGRLEEFFVRATGCTPNEFCSVSEFGDTVRSRASSIARRSECAFEWLDTEVRQYLALDGMEAFRAAKKLGGLKLVLGGSSRFQETQLNSVMGTALYCDTILIPDPIMPWLERERAEEKFQHVLVLKAAHAILQLKPLVDAALPYPPLVVFPSFEKSLEEHDEQTRLGIAHLLTEVVGWAAGQELSELDEVIEFSDSKPEEFLQSVDRSRLFIAPGGSSTSPLRQALQQYEDNLQTWRSAEWLKGYFELPVHRRVLNGIFERIGPIYHMMENAQEFSSHPLMCIEQQAHYF